MKPGLSKGLDRFLEILYPERARCMGCGTLSGTENRWLCEACRERLKTLDLIDAPKCRRCGRPLNAGKPCEECTDWPEDGVSRSLIRYAYALPVSGVVRGMKYAGVYRLTSVMAEDMLELLDKEGETNFTCIVPVPMHPKRLRERGVNGPERIAMALSEKMDAPVINALYRTRYTLQQAKLSPQARMRALTGAFRVADPDLVSGGRILLVDDVLTTGTTANRCAEALFHAGAREVVFVAFAGHANLQKGTDTEREPE